MGLNVANGKPVIGGSGDWPNFNFNTGTYQTDNVTDGQNAADPANNSGQITEPSVDGSFWLGWEGASTGYFVLDLGEAFDIGRIVLFNTRNGPHNDRGTGDFKITASNSIAPGPAGTGDGFGLTGRDRIRVAYPPDVPRRTQYAG